MSYSVKEQIELAQAWENGEELEWRPFNDGKWTPLLTKEQFINIAGAEIQFDFVNNEYRIKSKWWRAKKNDSYYHITTMGDVVSDTENYSSYDKNRYKFGNYFYTKEQAVKARDLIKECLINFHEEND